jgi:hypothetical protein
LVSFIFLTLPRRARRARERSPAVTGYVRPR